MKTCRSSLLVSLGFILLTGCAGSSEHARGIMHSQAREDCLKLSDATAYLECKKRADTIHAKR